MMTPAIASDRAIAIATNRCGPLPISATIGDLVNALRQADRELEHIVRLAHRYYRRFGIDDDGRTIVRLLARRDAAHRISEQRAELIRQLIAPRGSA